MTRHWRNRIILYQHDPPPLLGFKHPKKTINTPHQSSFCGGSKYTTHGRDFSWIISTDIRRNDKKMWLSPQKGRTTVPKCVSPAKLSLTRPNCQQHASEKEKNTTKQNKTNHVFASTQGPHDEACYTGNRYAPCVVRIKQGAPGRGTHGWASLTLVHFLNEYRDDPMIPMANPQHHGFRTNAEPACLPVQTNRPPNKTLPSAYLTKRNNSKVEVPTPQHVLKKQKDE